MYEVFGCFCIYPKIANRMGESELLAKATLAAPVAAAIGAGLFAIKNRKPKE